MSFNVTTLGGEVDSLRGSEVHAFCGEPAVTVTIDQTTYNLKRCTDKIGVELVDDTDAKLIVDKDTCEPNKDAQNKIDCFNINTTDCNSNEISFYNEGCPSPCYPFTALAEHVQTSSSVNTSTFFWSNTDQDRLMSQNFQEFSQKLLEENWKDESFQQYTHFDLKCTDSQEWIFQNPGSR